MADQLLTGTTLVENTSRSNGDVPIGGIIAWLKSLTGVYNFGEGWVECNGQTLVDAQSSLNGQTIPDLNGFTGTQRFLRGGGNADGTTPTASGATGGSEGHAHTGFSTYDDRADFAIGGSQKSFDLDNIPASGITTGSASTLPTYYGVVWIMRVR